uniref:Uncharacterized protein n=1 Tax=Lepeophtheirus salmonis TaxID=72036 RepID=A0A0K2TGU0_LEPSM
MVVFAMLNGKEDSWRKGDKFLVTLKAFVWLDNFFSLQRSQRSCIYLEKPW